ncbi:MAG: hypothetical protein BWY57_00826 [Betaproteobacteria bacterium ADurb.Bin341]|nr:MAG: hypothetical protein BWY57_00826 [Betaproteobacteria bacterium ADurb.Bin341]
MRERVEFDYEISDERLIAWSRKPILERLQMLDNIRQFTLAARQAPTVRLSSPTNPSASPPD